MKVGMIGLGKLGLPVALVMDLKGHSVMGYDVNPTVMQKERCAYREQGPNGEPSIEPILQKSNLLFGSLADVVKHSEIIFVAVQTPHEERYEGITPIPYERVDFNYEYLIKAVVDLSREVEKAQKEVVLVIISTVLPGTIRNRIVPVTSKLIRLCYNPFFIAMGTTMHDFLNPEFVLFGVWDEEAAEKAEAFYKTIHSRPFYKTAVENAELIKVAYNTFIGLKIVYVNTLMEICHKTPGTDVDAVTNGLKLATDRLISPRYLMAGMGDGGGCHPRDNIALSWLAKQLSLSFDLFEAMMLAREKQASWLVDLMCEHRLPKVILGKSFKPESSLEIGSPSILCKNLLEARGHDVLMYDPYIDPVQPEFEPSVFLIGTRHPQFETFQFPKGSVVIDPWRYVKGREDVTVIHVGGADSKQEVGQETPVEDPSQWKKC
jgi:UDPglucose 6-dehydrogenase